MDMDRAHHVATLSENLYKLQLETKLCDIELQCCDGEVYAHSAVLSSSSSVLQSVITGINMKLPMKAYSKDTVQRVIQYLYTGFLDCDYVEDAVSLYKVMTLFGQTADLQQLKKIAAKCEDGRKLLEDDCTDESTLHQLTPGPPMTLSAELFQNLTTYNAESAGMELDVKEEDDNAANLSNVSDEADEDSDNAIEYKRAKEKSSPKGVVSKIKEAVKLSEEQKARKLTKERQSKKHAKLRRSGRRKARKPKCIKPGHVGTYKEVESKSETVEEKRAKWREVYYKKKAMGTLKYQKFLSPKLPPDRKCNICGLVLRTYRSFVQHKNVAHNVPFSEEDIERLQMRCTFPGCDFISARPVKMQYHRETHDTENQEAEKEFSCSFCDKKYKSKRELRNHSKCHTASIRNCEICDKPLKGYYYSVHMNTVHNKDHVWQCHLCDYRVRGRELWFKYHLMTKHNDTSRGSVEIFKCQYCDYTAPKKQNVDRHTRVRHEIALGLRPKEAICDICGKEFGEKGLMVAHRARHTDPERFKCSFCTYRSPDYRSFETHVRTQHTQKDIRPWKCDLCSHAAKEKGNLKKHFRSKHKMSDEDAAAKMKTIKADTTAPIYVPLSEYKDPENNSVLPPPPRHRVTPKIKTLQSEQFMPHGEDPYVNKSTSYQETPSSGHAEKTNSMEIDQSEYHVAESMIRIADPVRTMGSGDPSIQSMPSHVAAVLQAAENTQQPSLHTLAAAAMMPQSMHPSMSMYAGLPQMHSNGLPSQVNSGVNNVLPTATPVTLPQPPMPSDMQLPNQSQQQQQHQIMSHPSQQSLNNQQHYSMPVKYENAQHPSSDGTMSRASQPVLLTDFLGCVPESH